MKILIVTQYLDNFSGSELFVLNISKELADNGHDVSVFSPVLGKIAEKARGMGIPVTDNLLDYKNEKFDIIHAQHNPTAILARSVFPKTPMVFMSHGFLPELEQPPSIDLGIEQFIVLSEETKEHLVKNHLIPGGKITLLNNSIDTEKFYPKRKPAQKPQKILVISNHYTDEVKNVVEGAATDLNMEIVHAGMPDNPVPSETMPDYINRSDIVVTLGLGALEAMACARNVIIYDIHGADGMVDEKNFFEIRKNNFSGRRYKYKYSKDSFKKELLKYNPMTGERLRKIVLKEHAFKQTVDDLVKLYNIVKDSKVGTNFKKFTLYNEIEFLERFSPTNAEIREEIAQEIVLADKNRLISEYEKIVKTQEDIIKQKDQEIKW
ncbi:glycosyltransferase family 4 protein, partial [Candidatus Microgenomates bacterium]|nr:glycosyltransferase family 4 protein [Candidatus Microgenomates bacterium]